MKRVEMLTITQIIEQKKTDLSRRSLERLVQDGAFEGVEVVGTTSRIPMIPKNEKKMWRQRKPKSSKSNNNSLS